MKHIHFDVDKAGFYGAYWENKIPVSTILVVEEYRCQLDIYWEKDNTIYDIVKK